MKGDDEKTVRLAIGSGSNLGKCRNVTWTISKLVERLKTPNRTAESLKQYLKLPVSEQDKLKVAPGWMLGGPCDKGRRAASNIKFRDYLTLDIDNDKLGLLWRLILGTTWLSGYRWVLHTTRKHTPENPRFRLIIFLSEPISADRYAPLTRIVASYIDATMDSVDDVSHRVAQMMYFPSCSHDSEFIFHDNPGELLDGNAILDAWGDWTDLSKLPFSEKQGQKRESAKKAEDPTTKAGIVGAFCRAYDIPAAIETFLSDVYAPGDDYWGKPRYTFIAGSTTNGAVVEDGGAFLYSHHTSDPCSDKLVNSFDLVRLHKYGDLDGDIEPDARPGSLESFKAMVRLCQSDSDVLREYNPRIEELFDDEGPEEQTENTAQQNDAKPREPTENLRQSEAKPERNDAKPEQTKYDPDIEDILGKKKLTPTERMNRKHAVAVVAGKTVILNFRKGEPVTYSTPTDLNVLYANLTMPTPTGGQEPISAWWLKQTERRTYEGGIAFAPGNSVPKNVYNLWEGFAVKPDPTKSCSLFLEHVRKIICAGDKALFTYWCVHTAHMIQKPQEKPGVALVYRGLKGAGKDTVAEYVGSLFPRNHVTISQMDQLTGKFNAHQEKALLLHVEEGMWAGDKAAVGPLNRIITSSTAMIEPKGLNAFEVASYCRVVITSNANWVVPATTDERRYAVFDVKPDRSRDTPYFRAIWAQHANGGREALLHFLQTFDLTGHDVRIPPRTRGLARQIGAGLKDVQAFWFQVLEDGIIKTHTDFDEPQNWDRGEIEVKIEDLYDQYETWLKKRVRLGHNDRPGMTAFGMSISDMCPSRKRRRGTKAADRGYLYVFPKLATARAEFVQTVLKAPFEWPDDSGNDEEDLIG